MNSKSLVGYSKPGITKIYTPATQSSARSGHGKVDPPIVQLVEFRPESLIFGSSMYLRQDFCFRETGRIRVTDNLPAWGNGRLCGPKPTARATLATGSSEQRWFKMRSD